MLEQMIRGYVLIRVWFAIIANQVDRTFRRPGPMRDQDAARRLRVARNPRGSYTMTTISKKASGPR